jgi:hypothetical protein
VSLHPVRNYLQNLISHPIFRDITNVGMSLRSRLSSYNIVIFFFTRLTVNLEYRPRSRPSRPILPCGSLLSTIKPDPEEWYQILSIMPVRHNSGLQPIVCNVCSFLASFRTVRLTGLVKALYSFRSNIWNLGYYSLTCSTLWPAVLVTGALSLLPPFFSLPLISSIIH